jgi:glycosyltransferase involved in cell wall biosynthesis
MSLLVSILIPAYNSQDTIAETLRSALAQNWPAKEIIVVDDGSRDRTLEIARSFAAGNVKVITQQNQGAAAARNNAYSNCQGDYIQWLDADDLLSPDKIARQMNEAEKCSNPRALLSCGWAQFVTRSDTASFIPTALWENLTPVEWLLRKMGLGLHMQTATWLVSRHLSEAAGPWDTRLSLDDDGEYFCRVLLAAEGTRFVPGTGVYYRFSGQHSLSFIGNSARKGDSLLLSLKLHVAYLRSLEDSPRVRKACLAYLQKYHLDVYPERPDLVAELQRLAAQLNGRLDIPRLSWKYAWLRSFVGYQKAKHVQFFMPHYKVKLIQLWDKALSLW